MSKIVVRKLEMNDLETRVNWLNNINIGGQMGIEMPVSLSNTKEWFKRNLLNNKRRDFVFDLHGDNPSGKLVAMGGLTEIDIHHRRAESYMMVDINQKRRGIGSKAFHWIHNFGFVIFNLNKIYGFVYIDNIAALEFDQKIGYKIEGLLRKHAFHNGKFYDRYLVGILREDWEQMEWHSADSPTLEILL